jgi:hypothetical protein
MIYPIALAGGFKVNRVCKKCGAKVAGTDPTNLSLNYAAHMRLHAKS